MIDNTSLTDLPSWFNYPQKLISLLEQEDIDFGSWQLLHGKWLSVFDSGLKKRYPNLQVVPFARRIGSDDVACFDVSKESTEPPVVIIHDHATPGWEQRGGFDGFNQWLDAATLEDVDPDEIDE